MGLFIGGRQTTVDDAGRNSHLLFPGDHLAQNRTCRGLTRQVTNDMPTACLLGCTVTYIQTQYTRGVPMMSRSSDESLCPKWSAITECLLWVPSIRIRQVFLGDNVTMEALLPWMCLRRVSETCAWRRRRWSFLCLKAGSCVQKEFRDKSQPRYRRLLPFARNGPRLRQVEGLIEQVVRPSAPARGSTEIFRRRRHVSSGHEPRQPTTDPGGAQPVPDSRRKLGLGSPA